MFKGDNDLNITNHRDAILAVVQSSSLLSKLFLLSQTRYTISSVIFFTAATKLFLKIIFGS